MDENNNDDKKAMDKVKKGLKTVVKYIPTSVKLWIIVIIACLLLTLLAAGVINAIPYLIKETFASLFSGLLGGSNSDDDSSSSSTVTESVVYIDEDGKYKLKVEDLAQQILDELESQKVNTEVTGFDTEEFGDMIDEYIDAEVKTTLLKTGQSDLDGMIVLKRALANGNIINLNYVSARDFNASLASGDLTCFSIDPDTFELWLVTENSSTTYYKNGVKVEGMSEGGGFKKEVINYQKYVQNYAVPLNFFITLHVISQDVDFMEDVLDMVLGADDPEPIVLTYVDSKQHYETTYEYSGRFENEITYISQEDDEYSNYDENKIITTLSEEAAIRLYEQNPSEDIDNDNIDKYADDIPQYDKSVVTTNSGTLYLTKANTWLKSSSKTITERGEETTGSDVTSEELKNITIGPHYYTITDADGNVIKLMKRIKTTKITQTITSTSSSKAYTVVDDGSEIIVDDFVELIKSYPKVENNFSTAPSNIFYLLQQSESTQKLEKIMRYVLYVLNDIDYGVTLAQLEYLLADAQEYKSTSQLLRDYIRYWEHSSPPPTNSDGTCYIIETDGYGNPTVGYGVDINAQREHFVLNGYPTEIGQEVPIEFVDGLEESEISDAIEEIKAITSGIELTGYQLNALVSRAYNCGVSGATRERNGKSFVQAYEAYWNPETDDLFEERDSNADESHLLYTSYMKVPNTAKTENGSVYSAGLARRRLSEWILFQTGYYNVLDRWHTNADSILDACVTVMNELEQYNVYYDLTGLPTRIDFESSEWSRLNCCCATYTTRVLYISGVISADIINNYGSINSSGANCGDGVEGYLIKAGWTKVSEEEAQPGDVCIWHNGGTSGNGHVFIYAGGNDIWDQRSGCIRIEQERAGKTPAGGTQSLWNKYKNEHNLCIFRMP